MSVCPRLRFYLEALPWGRRAPPAESGAVSPAGLDVSQCSAARGHSERASGGHELGPGGRAGVRRCTHGVRRQRPQPPRLAYSDQGPGWSGARARGRVAEDSASGPAGPQAAPFRCRRMLSARPPARVSSHLRPQVTRVRSALPPRGCPGGGRGPPPTSQPARPRGPAGPVPGWGSRRWRR